MVEDEGGRAPRASQAPARARRRRGHGIILENLFVGQSRRLICLVRIMMLPHLSFVILICRMVCLFKVVIYGVVNTRDKHQNGTTACNFTCCAVQIGCMWWPPNVTALRVSVKIRLYDTIQKRGISPL